MNRLLSVNTNATGYITAAGAVYAAADMIYNVVSHHAVFNASVAVAGVAALMVFFARQTVTPVADPKDLSGHPLVVAVPAEPPAAAATTTPPQGASF
jgi:hypothetical protein